MGKVIDLTGKRFGHLIVISLASLEGKGKSARWNCVCDCEKNKTVASRQLIRGYCKSCGPSCQTKNIVVHDPLYQTAADQKDRCTNPNNEAYKNYGGRGINFNFKSVKEAVLYYRTLGPKPSPSHTLDRKNNDGHYEVGNTRWATRRTQALNTRKRENTTSRYKGVHWNKRERKWGTNIRYQNKKTTIGYFKTEYLAHLAYEACLHVLETSTELSKSGQSGLY